jgi:hypothetical protein
VKGKTMPKVLSFRRQENRAAVPLNEDELLKAVRKALHLHLGKEWVRAMLIWLAADYLPEDVVAENNAFIKANREATY